MNVLAFLAVILLIAFLVESLVEYLFGQFFAHIEALKPYSWCLMYIAAAVGVLGAFHYQLDLVSLLSIYLGLSISISWFGMVLTGLAIGRGSNYIHDIVVKFFTKP
jgi:hypothetical protein